MFVLMQGLAHVANTPIGDERVRGVSGHFKHGVSWVSAGGRVVRLLVAVTYTDRM